MLSFFSNECMVVSLSVWDNNIGASAKEMEYFFTHTCYPLYFLLSVKIFFSTIASFDTAKSYCLFSAGRQIMMIAVSLCVG